jgi:cell division protein FtsB
MVWTMWQGWNDEYQKNLRLEREIAHLKTTLRRVADERDKLKEERDKLEEENKKLRNT